jgi:hypothetical protein
MHIKEVHVERLVNLGNYENKKIGVTISLHEGEDPHLASKLGKEFVLAELDLISKK